MCWGGVLELKVRVKADETKLWCWRLKLDSTGPGGSALQPNLGPHMLACSPAPTPS